MTKNIAGLGRKRPQLNIPVELLDLDPENPRLAKESQGGTEFDLLQTLYNDFDIDELAYSMSENGYFDEEPIVVIPRKLPLGFILPNDVEQQQKELQDIVNLGKTRFIVVEGNRRVATLKLLNNEVLRKKIKLSSDFPIPTSKILEEELKIIPAIFYPDRTNISAYLGVRHINGNLKWDAYTKAKYIAHLINEGNTIEEVQQFLSDRTNSIPKFYICYKLVQQIENEFDLKYDFSRLGFSFLLLAIGQNSIKQFLNLPDKYNEINFERPIGAKKINNLKLLFSFLYGDNKNKFGVLKESGDIAKYLIHVIDNPVSLEYLISSRKLRDAFEKSIDEKDMLIKNINNAKTLLINAHLYIEKHKDKDVLYAVTEIEKALIDLKNNFIMN